MFDPSLRTPVVYAIAVRYQTPLWRAGAMLRAGVLVQPLSWHRMRPGPPGFVLGYAAHTPDRLHEAARRIAQALC